MLKVIIISLHSCCPNFWVAPCNTTQIPKVLGNGSMSVQLLLYEFLHASTAYEVCEQINNYWIESSIMYRQ